MQMYKDDGRASFNFGVGGDEKLNSSSWILSEWKHSTEERQWGKSLKYHESEKSKVKRLVIAPGRSISMQYHNKRSEMWFVEHGLGEITTIGADGNEFSLKVIRLHEYHHIGVNTWHKLKNIGDGDLSIIEI